MRCHQLLPSSDTMQDNVPFFKYRERYCICRSRLSEYIWFYERKTFGKIVKYFSIIVIFSRKSTRLRNVEIHQVKRKKNEKCSTNHTLRQYHAKHFPSSTPLPFTTVAPFGRSWCQKNKVGCVLDRRRLSVG